jgi:hypothetical protein
MIGFRAFTDPAGGTIGGDSFALAIAHLDNEIAVHDLLFERPGPFPRLRWWQRSSPSCASTPSPR